MDDDITEHSQNAALWDGVVETGYGIESGIFLREVTQD